jgi:hypothetical protein
MRYRYIGGALLAAVALLVGPSAAQAQIESGYRQSGAGIGDDGGFQTPINTSPINPLPTGKSGDAGFYTAFEFVMLTQTRAIGNQTVAIRGFFDGDGLLTGTPGKLVGDGTEALNPNMLGQRTFAPGFNVELGYRLNDGTRVFVNYLHTFEAQDGIGATFVPPGFAVGLRAANTFISSPVFNFGNLWAGPTGKATGVADSTIYGIWNGASQENMKFSQDYSQWQTGLRTPLFQTDYSRVYGSAGFQFSWIWERFWWRALSQDQAGNNTNHDAADYSNTLSQRMYGPFLGTGHEIFIANQFSISLDLTASILLNVEKERAKYELADRTAESKWGRIDWGMVPNANAAVNFWWYPLEGVQIRAGYQVMTFFNTVYMRDPVGFNFGNIEPGYAPRAFRIIHGFNIGVGFFF